MFTDETGMSKLERDGQLIEKIDIPARPEELPDDLVEVDFESSHLSKYFSSQAWHHIWRQAMPFNVMHLQSG